MIENDLRRIKTMFWFAWVIANIIGLGAGWVMGELIGRQVADIAGWRVGQAAGALIYEGTIWAARGLVLSRVSSYKILKPFDIFIWIIAEVFGLMVGGQQINQDSITAITFGNVMASCWGAMMWLIIWFIKIPKAKTEFWAVKAALWVFLGLLGGSIFFGLTMATSLELGNALLKMGNPILGMALAGSTLGLFLGSLTGVTVIQLLRWPAGDE